MSIYANVGGAQKSLSNLSFNKDGASKILSSVYGNVDGASKILYPTYTEVLASSLSAGDTFWVEDSEGLSEYVVTDTPSDFGGLETTDDIELADIGYIPAIRVNALDVNIVSALDNAISTYGVLDSSSSQFTSNVNDLDYVVSYVSSISSKIVSFRVYKHTGYNGIGGVYKVILGREDLQRDDSNTYRVGRILYDSGAAEFSRVVNTKTKSNVLCFYNTGYAEDLTGSMEAIDENGDTYYYDYTYEEGRIYFYKNGKIYTSTLVQYNYEDSGTKNEYTLPSAVYFRPAMIFRGDINVLVRT